MISIAEIQRVCKGTIRLGEPLSRYSALGIGGPADYFFAPASAEDAVRLLQYLHSGRLPWLLANTGSRLLVSEQGYKGAALNLESGLSGLEVQGETVIVQSGVRVAGLVDVCIQNSLEGAEVLAGIPGTVGDWLRARCTVPESFVRRIVRIGIVRKGEELILAAPTQGFLLEQLDGKTDVVLKLELNLVRGNKAELMRKRRAHLLARNAAEPLNVARSCRMFRDPQGPTAAGLIAEAGLKGKTVGGATLFGRFPNYVIADVHAVSADVFRLIRVVQRTVRNKCGVELEPVIDMVGFEEELLALVA